MSFESKMRKHIQKVFDENVPNPYEKVEVKKTFSLKKMLMPLGVAALACTAVVAIVVPLAKSNGLGLNKEEMTPGSPANSDPDSGQPEKSGKNENFVYDPNFVEKMSIAAAPKASVLSSMDNGFVNKTAEKTLQSLDSLFNNTSNVDYVVSPASYLLGVAGLAAVSDGINADDYGLTDPLNETKMLLENWNCVSRENGEIVSKIDSGILHQQVGARFKFNDAKRASVEDEYIATSAARPDNYRQQAQEYFANNVKLSMSVPDLAITRDSVVSYSTLKFNDDADLGRTEKCRFYKGTDMFLVDACVYGDSSEHTYQTDVYENTKYTAFKRQVRNSDILFIVPKNNVSLEEITISEAYKEFMNNKTDCMAYGYIPYFHNTNIGMDVSAIVKKTFTGSERLYSKILDDDVNVNSIRLKMIQNSDYGFEDDGTFSESNSSYNPGEDAGEQAVCLNVDRPFYAICLKDDFPMFVNKVTNVRR